MLLPHQFGNFELLWTNCSSGLIYQEALGLGLKPFANRKWVAAILACPIWAPSRFCPIVFPRSWRSSHEVWGCVLNSFTSGYKELAWKHSQKCIFLPKTKPVRWAYHGENLGATGYSRYTEGWDSPEVHMRGRASPSRAASGQTAGYIGTQNPRTLFLPIRKWGAAPGCPAPWLSSSDSQGKSQELWRHSVSDSVSSECWKKPEYLLLEYLYSLIRKTMAKGIDCEWWGPSMQGSLSLLPAIPWLLLFPSAPTLPSLPGHSPGCAYPCSCTKVKVAILPWVQPKWRWGRMHGGGGELEIKVSRMVHMTTPAALASAFLYVCSRKNPLFPKQNSKVSMARASPIWQGHKSQPCGCHV